MEATDTVAGDLDYLRSVPHSCKVESIIIGIK